MMAMSLFRRPGDSSSSSDSSGEGSQYEEDSPLQQDSVLSRINTLDSASSEHEVQPHPPALARQSSTQNVRDLLLHSLLEERTIREVAAQLGKDPSDPEVQQLGRASYKEIARQMSHNVDDTYASDEMQAHRSTANEGINRLTRSNLSKLAVIPEIAAQALVTAEGNRMPASAQLQLKGYPHLQTDRYNQEFSELETVGKGGYGKVFKAKHKLDGSFYAVKRIPVSAAKVARIQEHPEELESMLEEVRSLARFDHNNIIRYHNAWLEFTTLPGKATGVLRDDRLLENGTISSSFSGEISNIHSQLHSQSFDGPNIVFENINSRGIIYENSNSRSAVYEHSSNHSIVFERNSNHSTVFEDSNSHGIVFELSEPGEGMTESQSGGINISKRNNRRGSQATIATIATISSAKSKRSAVEDANEDDDDDDVENIPRSYIPSSQEEAVTDVSESMVTNSDMPRHLMQKQNLGPVLMLNVQMSLCESNLAAFLSSGQPGCTGKRIDQHCFHTCVSLELLNNIVSGVEYLHAQGVVHRDLKPANVFLSLSTARHAPYGSIDLSSCKPCSARDRLHMTPRIGDFGLVAALSDSCAIHNLDSKPVGTEFYRPSFSSGINEKLDIFSLGVIAFEMLCKFSTRMERANTLTELRQGFFPFGFAESHGDAGVHIQHLISTMMDQDEEKRFNCEEIKEELKNIVAQLKM